MKIIEPYVELESEINGEDILKTIEKVGRVCYKSEDRITEESAKRFVESLMKRGHESVIEHVSLSVRVVCDRGVTHEIVRHRVASYAQESTRYCNYGKDKFDNELTFINPCFWTGDEDKDKKDIWINTMKNIENQYLELLKIGATPEEARSILPNSLKTEIIITMNLREWRHFFKLRTSKAAHPQMRQVAFMILEVFKEKVPVIFDDIIR
ncbi:thymidylate synthase, flavin-dependent [Clostridium bornimense]|uniref:FAD-dependent thymidylate synthase n=1 Tax=Clostridium bornimense TaxID=1216932 RepID=W6S0H8_9CLOT|nr:FAD-dependent thymidylate synthase [Clostridium bornimense]CDM69369.1 thymidylate synthase, flavin-dependent [Clostridium bornimense]